MNLFEKDWTTLLACLLASIQPRTSPSKFGGNYSILFNRVLKDYPYVAVDTEFPGCVAKPSGTFRSAKESELKIVVSMIRVAWEAIFASHVERRAVSVA